MSALCWAILFVYCIGLVLHSAHVRIFLPVMALSLLTGCISPEQDVRFRRSVESIDFKGGVSATEYGARGSIGGRINFRDPDLKGYAK